MDFNPDWKVMYWYPKFPVKETSWNSRENAYTVKCTDYLFDLTDLPITQTAVDFVDYGFSNSMSEVHKSDFLRSHLLATYGGLWSDMDIIYFKSMNNLEVNNPAYKNIETFVSLCRYGHSIGFMMATPDSKFFKKITDRSRAEYDPGLYQTIGSELYNKYGKTIEAINTFSPAVNIKMDAVYAHDASMIAELWDGSVPRFTEFSIGVHWYAGYILWNDFITKTDGGRINLPNAIIGNILHDAQQREGFRSDWNQ